MSGESGKDITIVITQETITKDTETTQIKNGGGNRGSESERARGSCQTLTDSSCVYVWS